MSTLKFLENYCGIYGYQNTNTGKIHYIGQTIRPFIIRDKQHRIQKTNTLCDRKLQKHPEEYQMIPILPFTIGNTTNEELNQLEEECIKMYNTFHDNDSNCWNLETGGKVCTVSDKTKQKLSERFSGENNPMWGKKHSEKTKQKISENHADFSGENHPMWGKKHPEKTKQKMSEKKIGKNNPMYGRTGENHPLYSKKLSEEHKLKMSKAHNTSGYFRVCKKKDKNYKQGFTWVYQYTDENSKKKILLV